MHHSVKVMEQDMLGTINQKEEMCYAPTVRLSYGMGCATVTVSCTLVARCLGSLLKVHDGCFRGRRDFMLHSGAGIWSNYLSSPAAFQAIKICVCCHLNALQHCAIVHDAQSAS